LPTQTLPLRAIVDAWYAPSNYNHYNAIQTWRVTEKGGVENVYL